MQELENQSLLSKKGKRGRSLSESGKAYLSELGEKLERNEIVTSLLHKAPIKPCNKRILGTTCRVNMR